MDTLVKIGAFLGFLAFLQVGSLTSKVNRLIREGRSLGNGMHINAHTVNAHIMKDMLEPYIGSRIGLDFFEDEGDVDIFFDNDLLLLAVDEKWALLEITDHGKKKQKLIRLSSLKGISTKK